MFRFIILFVLVSLQSIECIPWNNNWNEWNNWRNNWNNDFGYQNNWNGGHNFWRPPIPPHYVNRPPFPQGNERPFQIDMPKAFFPKNRKPYDHESFVLSNPRGEAMSEEIANQQFFPNNRKPYDHENFVKFNQREDMLQGSSNEQFFPNNRKLSDHEIPVQFNPRKDMLEGGANQQFFPNNRKLSDHETPVQFNPRKVILEEVVNQILQIDKQIKSFCNKGHNPSEDITVEYYKRRFNITGFKPDTATIRIKHTVLYSCLDSLIKGRQCLEDLALLPEHLAVEEAVYYIENNILTIKIPFKRSSEITDTNVCANIDERDVIVSKKPRPNN